MWSSSEMMTKVFLVFFICVSLICVSCAIPNDLQEFSSEEQVWGLFQQWQSEHGRVYPTPQEEAKRFHIFQSNLKHINEMNAKRKYRLGLNKFADLSAQEFRKIHLHHHINNMPTNTKYYSTLKNHEYSTQDLPDSIDWREKGAVTEVKEQGNCESHWAFAVVGAIEGINAINTGELITLSAQQLIDCDPASNGCSGGYYFNAFGWVIDNGGIDTQLNYPYTASNGVCKNGSKVVSIEKLNVVVGSESGLLSAVSKQPVTTSVDAVDFQLYTGGIYGGDNCEKNSTNASLVVLVVGYGSENGEDYWIVKNSWGKDWGENGYIRMKRNGSDWPYGVCAIANLVGYPSQSTTPSLFQA